MSVKEKLAATLLNQWYVIERGLEIHRIKKPPPLAARYAVLDDLKAADYKEDKVNAVIAEFSEFNKDALVANCVWICENDETIKELEVELLVSKQKNGMRASLIPTKKTSVYLISLRKALNGPNQNPKFKEQLDKLPEIMVDNQVAPINTELSAPPNIIKNYSEYEADFLARFSAAKLFLKASKTLVEKLSAVDLEAINSGKAFVDFKDVNLEGSDLVCGSFEVVETPAAQAARIANERLEQATRERTKGIKQVEFNEKTVNYVLDDEHRSFSLDLDVITNW